MRNLLPIQDLSEKPEGKAKNSLVITVMPVPVSGESKLLQSFKSSYSEALIWPRKPWARLQKAQGQIDKNLKAKQKSLINANNLPFTASVWLLVDSQINYSSFPSTANLQL